MNQEKWELKGRMFSLKHAHVWLPRRAHVNIG